MSAQGFKGGGMATEGKTLAKTEPSIASLRVTIDLLNLTCNESFTGYKK